VAGGIHQQVLRLDVAVAHPQAVDVRQRAKHLEHVHLDVRVRHALQARAASGDTECEARGD
jgi:hypothetical protein